jgi:hypothetical protein
VSLGLTRTSRLRFPGEASPYTQCAPHAMLDKNVREYVRVGIMLVVTVDIVNREMRRCGWNWPADLGTEEALNLHTALLTGTSLSHYHTWSISEEMRTSMMKVALSTALGGGESRCSRCKELSRR